ncbi:MULTISPECIES: tyrosine-type recombinase/integrase [unclassified Pseudomonas]|uniref:phage integrase n=1 Tax=unclassified Pseudomonas TaxID=196821 RepID=UPI00244BFCFF|nr:MULTISPECIES: tyrosine-type recombinase/integrase [unclassified Pseudomonas]MDH0894413.1 tyrosine-type recombinase/integrase [Pseudomonas sp. GD03875]MDH1063292.1 tyrosine-type recombinase/integrase [Pseudomonas sp. GD03985]
MAIEQLSDGRWRVDVEPIKGTRFRKKFKTKAEAIRFEATCRSRLIDTPEWSPKPADSRRLSALIASWYELHGYALRDGERRRSKLDALCKALRNPVAAKLSPDAYAHNRRIRLQSGTSGKTLNNELGYLRSVYNELRSLGQIDYANPLSLVRPLRLQERELSWLTFEQVGELLASIREGCDNPHTEPVTLICLATGARWSEAERLPPASLRSGVVTFSGTKSGKVRAVPIRPDLEALLCNHWKRYGQFTGCITSFRRALDRTSIELPKGQATHALRHTFASHFMQNGGNILTLQKILGHSSLAMTMRYAHLSPDHLADAIRLGPLSGFDTFSTLKEKALENL